VWANLHNKDQQSILPTMGVINRKCPQPENRKDEPASPEASRRECPCCTK
jgi:hypothetical protein